MPRQKPFVPIAHFEHRMSERNVDALWVRMVLEQPDAKEQQDDRKTRWRLWRSIPQNGDRMLCVVLDEHDDRFDIVTVFFDRRRKR